MGLLKKLRPARSVQVGDDEIVADLDAIESRSHWFRFKGQAYEIRPITTGEFMRVYAAFSALDSLSGSKEVTAVDIIDRYTDLFQSVCPEMTREIVQQMSQAQAGALFALIMECITGKVGQEKKKPLTESQPSPSA